MQILIFSFLLLSLSISHASEFDFIESPEISKEMETIGKKLENTISAEVDGVASPLTKNQCVEKMNTMKKSMSKSIYTFARGNPIVSQDLDGDYIQGPVGEEFGNFAKMGLNPNTFYRINFLDSKFAIHSDPRCGKYAKVIKKDYSVFKNRVCRRVHIGLDTIRYKVLFCLGITRSYVDHFNISRKK